MKRYSCCARAFSRLPQCLERRSTDFGAEYGDRGIQQLRQPLDSRESRRNDDTKVIQLPKPLKFEESST